MKKLSKALSVILALSMILTAFVFTVNAETQTTTYTVDFANLTDENDNFKFYRGSWGADLFTSLSELTGTATQIANGNMTLWRGNDGVSYMKAMGGPLVIEFTAPVAGTYRFDTAGSVPNPVDNGATKVSKYDASEGTYTDLTGETNITRVNYYWTQFNLSDTENPAAELDAGDKLYWTILNWGTFQAIVTKLSVVGTVEAPDPAGYTAAISATPTDVSRGGSTTVKVAVNGSVYTKYNSGELTVTYDNTKYDFVSSDIGTAKTGEGTVEICFYGADNEFTDTIDLVFTAKGDAAIGATADFTLAKAAFSDAETAASADLIEAEITAATATTTVVARTFEVTIDADEEVESAILAVQGNSTEAVEDQDYVITLPEGYENYTWTATVGENTYDVVGGKITVPAEDISGAFTVNITRTAKSFNVSQSLVDNNGSAITDNGVIFGNTTATFGSDYLAVTVPKDTNPDNATGASGYAYTVKAYYTSDETKAPLTLTASEGENGVSYTLAGTAVTEAITVVVTKTEVAVTQFKVTVNGPDTDKPGVNNVNNEQSFTFTVTPVAGFVYSVSAEGAELVKNGNTYTINSVTSDVTVTVTRTVDTDGVSVYNYLELNNKAIYEIVIKGDIADGYGYTYDGNAMLYNAEKDEYVYLVIVTDTLTADDAKAKVSLASGVVNTKYNVSGVDTDVNVTGKTDANDAQLVYNIYASKAYDSFDSLPMLKFLLADVNCDHSINVDDAAAVVDSIIG